MSARHWSFVDLTGQVVAGAKVLREVESQRGSSRWLARLACGCSATVEGSHLKQAAKKGREYLCIDHRSYAKRKQEALPLSNAERNARTYQRRKGLAPGNRGKGSSICKLCHSMPWRVSGPRCKNPSCRLLYAAEVIMIDPSLRKAVPWL